MRHAGTKALTNENGRELENNENQLHQIVQVEQGNDKEAESDDALLTRVGSNSVSGSVQERKNKAAETSTMNRSIMRSSTRMTRSSFSSEDSLYSSVTDEEKDVERKRAKDGRRRPSRDSTQKEEERKGENRRTSVATGSSGNRNQNMSRSSRFSTRSISSSSRSDVGELKNDGSGSFRRASEKTENGSDVEIPEYARREIPVKKQSFDHILSATQYAVNRRAGTGLLSSVGGNSSHPGENFVHLSENIDKREGGSRRKSKGRYGSKESSASSSLSSRTLGSRNSSNEEIQHLKRMVSISSNSSILDLLGSAQQKHANTSRRRMSRHFSFKDHGGLRGAIQSMVAERDERIHRAGGVRPTASLDDHDCLSRKSISKARELAASNPTTGGREVFLPEASDILEQLTRQQTLRGDGGRGYEDPLGIRNSGDKKDIAELIGKLRLSADEPIISKDESSAAPPSTTQFASLDRPKPAFVGSHRRSVRFGTSQFRDPAYQLQLEQVLARQAGVVKNKNE